MQGQSEPGSNGNEGVLHIPQSSSIAWTSPSDYLVSYAGHSLGVVLPLYREAVGVFYSPSWLGKPYIRIELMISSAFNLFDSLEIGFSPYFQIVLHFSLKEIKLTELTKSLIFSYL